MLQWPNKHLLVVLGNNKVTSVVPKYAQLSGQFAIQRPHLLIHLLSTCVGFDIDQPCCLDVNMRLVFKNLEKDLKVTLLLLQLSHKIKTFLSGV